MPERDKFQMLKDILFWEIPVPFAQAKEVKPGAPAPAAEEEDPRLKELQKVFQSLESQGKDVGSLLVESGLVPADMLEKVHREQQSSGLSLPMALVRLKVVPAAKINEVIESLNRAIMDRVSGQSIQKILLEEKLAAEDAIEKADELSRTARIPLEQALLELKSIELEALGRVFEKRFSIPWVDLKTVKLDSSLVRLIPTGIMRERRVVAFRKRGKVLDVAMMDPRDAATVDRLQIITGSKIQPYLADLRALGPALRKFVPDISEAQTRIQEIAAGDIQSASQEESTVQLVNKIIEGAINARATDIHLDPQDDYLRVRYRIDGMLYDIMTIQDQQMVLVSARVKVLANMNITERRRPQDGHITHAKTDGGKYDLRVSTLPTHLGEKIVLRLLDDSTVLKGMRQLGLEDKDLERVEQLIRRPYGMLLVTGPIGSGKTTMLYAALSEVNQANRNIITIEDPIEYQLPGINQVQVDPNIDMNFAEGLRGILRQDADILMVGEIRDAETAQTAVRAAMTGHLLFSTLHTNYAINAITTLRHLGVQPFLIAGSVIGVVAQRLVRRVCPHCGESFVPPLSMRPDLGLPKNSRKTIKRAVGCNECYHTGYIGRTGVYEVFSISPKIKEMIVDGASEEALLKTALEEGMTPLSENGKAKVLSGETTFDELMRVIYM